MVRSGEFPILLGGDCSILLGIALALRNNVTSQGFRVGARGF